MMGTANRLILMMNYPLKMSRHFLHGPFLVSSFLVLIGHPDNLH